LGGPFGGGFLLMSFKYLNKDQDIFDGDLDLQLLPR
jgi:hypothetical protein